MSNSNLSKDSISSLIEIKSSLGLLLDRLHSVMDSEIKVRNIEIPLDHFDLEFIQEAIWNLDGSILSLKEVLK